MERNLHATRLGDETYSFGIVSGLNQPVGTNVNEAWRIGTIIRRESHWQRRVLRNQLH
jgi:hypothetical protein